MEPWVWLIIGLLVGFVCGYGISVHLRAKTFAGTLREDHSDPTEAPYLFWSWSQAVWKKSINTTPLPSRVKIEDYLPRR